MKSNLTPLHVINIVNPSFGYVFSGPTKPILLTLRKWCAQNIELTLWGSDFLARDANSSQPPIWTGNLRNSRSIRLWWSARLLWMLIRRRKTYDLIHVHTLWWGGLLAPLFARLLGKKAIYHMTLLGSDTPGAVAAQSLGWLKLWLFKQYHGVIGLAPALVDDCHQQGFSSKVAVIPGYLTFELPSLADVPTRRERARQRLGIPERAQVLLFVGSIISRKGADLLVDLFIQLADQRPDLWLLLVGARTHVENPRLDEKFVTLQQARLEHAGLSARVVWAGLIRDEDELIDTYLASDLFVFPTRAEGMPNVVIEAMGCGLPVICSYLPGITDMMVDPNETGILVDVDDFEGFFTAVMSLLNDPVLCQNMGRAGRNRAIVEFGFDTYCHRLADFYRLIADRKCKAQTYEVDAIVLQENEKQK